MSSEMRLCGIQVQSAFVGWIATCIGLPGRCGPVLIWEMSCLISCIITHSCCDQRECCLCQLKGLDLKIRKQKGECPWHNSVF